MMVPFPGTRVPDCCFVGEPRREKQRALRVIFLVVCSAMIFEVSGHLKAIRADSYCAWRLGKMNKSLIWYSRLRVQFTFFWRNPVRLFSDGAYLKNS
jgi:hypothetical protein